MSKIGRPTHAAIAERQGQVVRFIAGLVATHDDLVKQTAAHVGAGERAVRGDLKAIAEASAVSLHSESDMRHCLPEDLVQEFERAETPDALLAVERRLWIERAAGRISPGDARTLVSTCRALRRKMSARLRRTVEAQPVASRDLADCLVESLKVDSTRD